MAVKNLKKVGHYEPPPAASLRALENAVAGDYEVAGIVLGLFNTILGHSGPMLVNPQRPIYDIDLLPARLRLHARAILAWGSRRGIILNKVIRARQITESAIVRMRRQSPLGRRRTRLANQLRKEFPPRQPDGRPRPGNLFAVDLLAGQIGTPVGHGLIRQVSALQPDHIEIRAYGEPFYSGWAERVASIRLGADGYSVESVMLFIGLEPTGPKTEVIGVLEDFFETGTEGIVWSVHEEGEAGYEALHPIDEGDHLTILDQLGRREWAGTIRCDRKVGWKRYPLNPRLGQPCALGYWVHWTQKGFTPGEWARFFIRHGRPRYIGILRKHVSKAKP